MSKQECGNCNYSDVGSTPWDWYCRLHNKTVSSSECCTSFAGTPSNYSSWICDRCGKTGNNEADRCALISPEGRKYYLCHSCFVNRNSNSRSSVSSSGYSSSWRENGLLVWLARIPIIIIPIALYLFLANEHMLMLFVAIGAIWISCKIIRKKTD